jgi:hypothetical protein
VVVDENETGVVMGFGSANTGKILGGQDLGRDLVGLNDKNVRLVKVEMMKEYKKRLIKLPKKIEIQVG